METKKLIKLMLVGLFFVFAQSGLSQNSNKQKGEGIYNKDSYEKISNSSVPDKVIKVISNFNGFKLKEVAVNRISKSNTLQVYLVTLIKGKRTEEYLIDTNGKILSMLE